jgi:hypothetical protein
MSSRPAAAATLTLLAALSLTAPAPANVVQRGDVRVAFAGALRPHSLPRNRPAPVSVSVAAKITPLSAARPPRLRSIAISINRYGVIHRRGLPVCDLATIQPATTADALALCSRSRVGTGSFSAQIPLGASAPFPSSGKVIAFNGVVGCSPIDRALLSTARGWPSRSGTQRARQEERTNVGRNFHAYDRGRRHAKCHPRPAILAHVYGTDPVPTSYTIPFLIEPAQAPYGTLLDASLAAAGARGAYVSALRLSLHRTFHSHGRRRSYLTASCPAPPGIPTAPFRFARARFSFAGAATIYSTLTRACSVR